MPRCAPVRLRATSTTLRTTVSTSRLALISRIASASLDARSHGLPSSGVSRVSDSRCVTPRFLHSPVPTISPSLYYNHTKLRIRI